MLQRLCRGFTLAWMSSLQRHCCISVPCLWHWTTAMAATDAPEREKMNPNCLPEHEVAADNWKQPWQSRMVQWQTAAANSPASFTIKYNTYIKIQCGLHPSSTTHHQLPASEPLLDGKIRHSLLPATTEESQPAELGICFGFSASALCLSGFGQGFSTGYRLKGQSGWEGMAGRLRAGPTSWLKQVGLLAWWRSENYGT